MNKAALEANRKDINFFTDFQKIMVRLLKYLEQAIDSNVLS